MGLILDTTILIAGERRGRSPEDILFHARTGLGETAVAISAVTVVELTHGIYRALSEFDRARRRIFAEKVFSDFDVQPVTFEIAQLAGRIEGE